MTLRDLVCEDGEGEKKDGAGERKIDDSCETVVGLFISLRLAVEILVVRSLSLQSVLWTFENLKSVSPTPFLVCGYMVSESKLFVSRYETDPLHVIVEVEDFHRERLNPIDCRLEPSKARMRSID